jgi:hypothetical protein
MARTATGEALGTSAADCEVSALGAVPDGPGSQAGRKGCTIVEHQFAIGASAMLRSLVERDGGFCQP